MIIPFISNDIQKIIDKYQQYIDDSNAVLGSTNYEISKSTLGAYATDAMINYLYGYSMFDGEIDVAIMNTGGIRSTIDKGEITKADIFEVFPFNNMVVSIPLDSMVDSNAEKERIAKEISRLTSEIERSEKLLNNAGFVAKAPASLIESEKEKLEKNKSLKAELEK